MADLVGENARKEIGAHLYLEVAVVAKVEQDGLGHTLFLATPGLVHLLERVGGFGRQNDALISD